MDTSKSIIVEEDIATKYYDSGIRRNLQNAVAELQRCNGSGDNMYALCFSKNFF